MENYENQEFESMETGYTPEQEEPIVQEAETTQEQMPQEAEPAENASSYRNAASPHQKSPYANSPYTRSANPEPVYQVRKPAKQQKAGKKFLKNAVAAVLALSVVAGGCAITAASVNSRWEARNAETVTQLTEKIESLQEQINAANRYGGTSVSGSPVAAVAGLTPGEVYARNVDSVVAITSTVTTSMYGQTAQGTSSGSGFILTGNGYVVTNHHVIENGTNVTVIIHDGTEYPAKVVGSDSTNDVAVLKVDAEGLPAVTLGSSDDLIIGDMVVAIGNPLGTLNATQTVGYVSGKNREVSTDNSMISMIQTDAAINSGNSGGPLFNMKGEVVGITTAKYSGTTGSGASIEGIGFAIPIDDIAGIIGDLQNLGYVTGAYLGVTVQNVDSESASYYGFPMGAYVASVVSGGSADRAGVQVKDIIVKLGDTKVGTVNELTRALRHFKAGDATTIVVFRGGQELSLTITLDEKPQDLNKPDAGSTEIPSEGDFDEWYDYFRKYFNEQG